MPGHSLRAGMCVTGHGSTAVPRGHVRRAWLFEAAPLYDDWAKHRLYDIEESEMVRKG